VILDTYKDANENIILIRCQINKCDVIIGSVYGPNTNNDSFFRDLHAGLENFRPAPIILGGDWNATNCMDPVPDNLDCFRMQDIPSLHRSRELNSLKDNFDLIDPYRVLNPLLTDYTYEPHGTVRKNRSRIDFFLNLWKFIG
jgi:exonuclease III